MMQKSGEPVLGGREIVRVSIVQRRQPSWTTRLADPGRTLIAEAAEGGTDLIVFPEVWLSGYPIGRKAGIAPFNNGQEVVSASGMLPSSPPAKTPNG